MSFGQLAFFPAVAVFAMNLALAATLTGIAGLAAAQAVRRRTAPLQHGILLITLGLVVSLPAAVWLGEHHRLGLVRVSVSAEQTDEPSAKRFAGEVPEAAALAPSHLDRPVAPAAPWAPGREGRGPPIRETTGLPDALLVSAGADEAAASGAGASGRMHRNAAAAVGWWVGVGTVGVWIWLVGIFVEAVWLGCGCAAVIRLRRGLEPLSDPRVTRLARQAAEAAGLRRVPGLLTGRCVPMPFCIGLIRTAVVLPASAGGDTEDGWLYAVLLHEMAHVARRDHWVGLLERLALAIFWWNPAIRSICRRIAELREEICDNYVARLPEGGERLARILVDLAAQTVRKPLAPSALGVLEPERAGLAGRITRLMSKERNMATRMNRVSLAAVLVFGAVVLAAVLSLGGLQLARAQAAATEAPAEEAVGNAAPPVRIADPVVGDVGPRAEADRFDCRGRVLGPDGKAVPEVNIYLVYYTAARIPPPKPRGVSDAEGNFRFSLTKADFRAAGSESPWLYSTLVAVPPPAASVGIDWRPTAEFDVTGRLREELVRKSPEAEARVKKPVSPLFRLVKDLPLSGRITCDGRPVAGAKITVQEVSASKSEDLTPWLQAVEKERADYYRAREHLERTFNTRFQDWSIMPAATTDVQGRFRLGGIGRERIAELLIEGPRIESREVHARTRPGPRLQVLNESHEPSLGTFTYYGVEFEHAARPSVPIVGTVSDKDTGKPLPGVRIQSEKLAGDPISGVGKEFVHAVTDAEGRYRLSGMPVNVPKRKPSEETRYGDLDSNVVLAVPPLDQPYLLSQKEVNLAPGKESVRLDFRLKRGVLIRGRVTDATTGQGVSAQIDYYVFIDNPHDRSAPGFRGVSYGNFGNLYQTDGDGRYQIPGLPGRGIVGVHAHEHERYPRGAGAEKISGGRGSGEDRMLETDPSYITPFNFHALAEVNVAENAQSVTQDFQLNPGQTLTGTVLDPEGRPLAGAEYSGLQHFPHWRPLTTAEFTINSYCPDESRTLEFVHRGRKLSGSRVLQGPQPRPISVRLGPWGAITGRVVDAAGKPRTGIQLSAFPGFQGKDPRAGSFPEQYHATDQEGRFRIEGLAPGLSYGLAATSDVMYLGEVASGVTIETGQTKDLGTLTIKPPKPPATAGKPKAKPAAGGPVPLASTADEAGWTALLDERFQGKYDSKWKILHEDATHLSFQKNPGHLTITTQQGSIHGDQDADPVTQGVRPRNMFLIPNPLAGKGDFRITLGVTRFEPTTPYHQVGLLCYNDDDNYAKWSFEASWRDPGTTNLVLVRETNKEPEHDLVVQLAKPKRFWLRVTKQGKDYQCSYSLDGRKFTAVGKLPWDDGAPKYLGFLAKNGGLPDTPEIDAVIESFELASPPDKKRSPAKPAAGRD